MFFKDLSCPDRQRARKRGEWFVRRGSTTDVGLPEDLSIIVQRQAELLVEPLRESLRNLQASVAKVEGRYNDALFRLVERAFSPNAESPWTSPEPSTGLDLPARLRQQLRTPHDAIAEDLIAEARAINDFLASSSTALPWAPQPDDATGNRPLIEDLEERTRNLQLAAAAILLLDRHGTYSEALFRVVKMLAEEPAPVSGVIFNSMGYALRFYPLCLLLYTIYVCGVAENHGDLLRRIGQIPLRIRNRESSSHISDAFFHLRRANPLFNHVFGHNLCEPITQRIRQIIGDYIGTTMPGVSEPEFFFRGEFVLALTHLDASMPLAKETGWLAPVPGLYLYLYEARHFIAELLREDPSWFGALYATPLGELLEAFDENAPKAVSPYCVAAGLAGFSAHATYQEAADRRNAKK